MAPRTTSAPPEAWDRIANAVRTRREELGLTAAQLVERAGGTPSLAVLSQIENGRRDRYASRTLSLLCNVLGWTSDSIERIAEGGEPVEQPQVPSPEIVAELQALRDELGRLTELVERMVSQRAGRR